MSGRLIAIGDMHGCSDALRALVGAIAPEPEDRIVTLGDYIDRGPDSRGVIDGLLALSRRCRLIPILGNHEEMLLGGLRGDSPIAWWLEHGGRATLASYGGPDAQTRDEVRRLLPAEHLAFLAEARDYYEADDHFFTHANYVAGAPLDQQPVEALRWQSLVEHLPKRHYSGKTAVVGHTLQRSGEPLDAGHLLCLDTFCDGGGWLTARDVQSGAQWQADRSGRLRDGGDRTE